jgi:hypothetical protein
MALVINDRVKETSTSTGNSQTTWVLDGAVTGFETFNAGIATTNTTYYAIFLQGSNEWEVGLGTLSTSTNLQRTTIITSSNSDNVVDFSAGTKDVFCTLPASKAVYLDASGAPVGAIASLVADTSPQLGGDLDLNSQNLDFPTTSNISDCLDEDAMGSNSATALATQQSIKAYSDAQGETFPTFTSTTPSVATNDLTSLVIAGTNFGSTGIPAVEFQASTGVITAASSVVRDSATQLTVGCTLGTDGTYFIRIELNNGLAVRSTTAVLTISDVPVWTTASGSLGTIAGDFSGDVTTVAATGDTVAYTETTDVLTNASLANCSLNSSTGVISTTDFGGSSTAATTYSFTLRATDAQAQTADRAFTLTSSFGSTGGGQFN